MQKGLLSKRMLVFLGLATVSVVAIQAATTAQPPKMGKMNLMMGRLPKSVSAPTARALLGKANLAAKMDDKKGLDEDMGMARQVETTLAAERTTLKKTLDQSPFYAKMLGEQKAILADTMMTPAQRMAAMKALESKYRPDFEGAVKASGLSIPAMQAKLAKISPDLKMTANFMVTRHRLKARPRPSATPTVTEETFDKPFGLETDDLSLSGITVPVSSDGNADAHTGSCDTDIAVADGVGHGNATAAVGQIIDVPAGVKRIEVTATINRSYFLWALSALAVSGGSAKGFLEIDGTSGQHAVDEEKFGSVIAPLLWFSKQEGDAEPVVLFASMNVPAQGGTFQVRTRVTSNVYTGGLGGGAISDINATCQQIKVRMIR